MKKLSLSSLFPSILGVFLLLVNISVLASETKYYFYVQFANKNNSPYSLSIPSEFLSSRAIERRLQRAPNYDSTDLPINPSYLMQIQHLGIQVHCRSKWMNGATVTLADSTNMSLVRALPFVKFVQYTGLKNFSNLTSNSVEMNKSISNYGTATAQIDQLNGQYLHNLGYRGKNIHIGVLDAGFNNVNNNRAFDSLRLQTRLLGTKDIVNPNSNIYTEDAHGASVLSTMTGNLPNQFLGTAPDASFWLIRTEYALTEYLMETDFWCAGIEFADSVGVDVVNSSLGYSTFDDSKMSFKYADMNGKVSRASRAATLAAQKGIIVVSSAGNEGAKSWHYISSPADAAGIITVGAVTSTGSPSTFSSFGPSSDHRVKPEICSLGTSAALVNTAGTITVGDGTSFASPIMAGMMACFLQASKVTCPSCTIETLLNAVFTSGSLHSAPTAQMGYGIPNFQTALAKLPFFNAVKITETDDFIIAYDRNDKSIHIRLLDFKKSSDMTVRLYSITGNLLVQQALVEPETVMQCAKLNTGMYLIALGGDGKRMTSKIIVQ